MKPFSVLVFLRETSERLAHASGSLVRRSHHAMVVALVVVLFVLAGTALGGGTRRQGTTTNTPAGNADSGKRLFVSYGCSECHGDMAQGGAAGIRLAPDPLPFATIVKYLRHPTGQMPPYTEKVVSDSDLANIYAFLQSVPPPPKLESIPLLK